MTAGTARKPRKRSRHPELFALVAGHFRVLGEPARLELLHALESGEQAAARLQGRTGMTQANLSKHMAVLCSAGFARRRREGRFVFYELADNRVLALCEIMCGRVAAGAESALELLAER